MSSQLERYYLNLNFFFYSINGKGYVTIMSDIDWDLPVLLEERKEILKTWIDGIAFGQFKSSFLRTSMMACYIDLEILSTWSHFFPKISGYSLKTLQVNHTYTKIDKDIFSITTGMEDLFYRRNMDLMLSDRFIEFFLMYMVPENLHPHKYIGNPNSKEIMEKYNSDKRENMFRQVMKNNIEFFDTRQIKELIDDISHNPVFSDIDYQNLDKKIIMNQSRIQEQVLKPDSKLQFIIDNVPGYQPSNLNQKIEVRMVPSFEPGKSIKVYSLIYKGDNRHIFKCVDIDGVKNIIESPCSKCSTIASIVRWHKTYENEKKNFKNGYSRSKAFFGWHYKNGFLYSKNLETIYTDYITLYYDEEYYLACKPRLTIPMTHKLRKLRYDKYIKREINFMA
jgi:hypothetical protein